MNLMFTIMARDCGELDRCDSPCQAYVTLRRGRASQPDTREGEQNHAILLPNADQSDRQ